MPNPDVTGIRLNRQQSPERAAPTVCIKCPVPGQSSEGAGSDQGYASDPLNQRNFSHTGGDATWEVNRLWQPHLVTRPGPLICSERLLRCRIVWGPGRGVGSWSPRTYAKVRKKYLGKIGNSWRVATPKLSVPDHRCIFILKSVWLSSLMAQISTQLPSS
jgi:hypothetical protein